MVSAHGCQEHMRRFLGKVAPFRNVRVTRGKGCVCVESGTRVRQQGKVGSARPSPAHGTLMLMLIFVLLLLLMRPFPLESPVHAAYAPLPPFHALRAHAHAAAPSVIHCIHHTHTRASSRPAEYL